MYWPLSAPTVYAASKDKPPQDRVSISDDDVRHAAVQISTAKTNGSLVQEHGEGLSPGRAAPDGSTEKQGQESPNNIDSTSTNSGTIAQALAEEDNGGEIIGLQLTRSGHLFATITKTTLTIWQTKPTAILASVLRSTQSLRTYGPNVALLLRPDSAIFVVQTSLGYLITYSLATDPTARVYRPQFTNNVSGHARRQSMGGFKTHGGVAAIPGPGEGSGIREISVRFRMVIRVDAGVAKALALDDELVVATEKPPAMQCIRWAPDSTGSQTSTELLSRMSWIAKKTSIVDMEYDRPMNLAAWIASDGKAYAVQRRSPHSKSEDGKDSKSLFKGYNFHVPDTPGQHAVKAAVNARFSLIAVGCDNGDVFVYTARDYAGHVPLSHKLHPSFATTSAGKLKFLSYSPDGYCLFAGYERGWMTWSVYGKPGANSFHTDRTISTSNEEGWLLGVRDGFWIGGGSEIILLGEGDNRLWMLEMARSAVTGCFSSANVSRSLLQTSAGFMIYRGYEMPDMTAISAEASLWHHVQVPSHYLVNQWPIRSAVISPDGRYVAVAGRRGLAHYSVNSGRWKTFEDSLMENEFTVRGGMCWYQHVLIAAVESHEAHEIRAYSRELPLDSGRVMHVETLPAPIVLLTTSGDDSLLVYTYENILYHYIINVADASVRLVRVGQIAFHGIIRAPPRVRALNWVLPEDHIQQGDPSEDVAVAAVLFLVDGKLVLLQPTTTEFGELKYEMRIIAQNVEYYALMRDQPYFNLAYHEDLSPPSPYPGNALNGYTGHDLRDSLWFFDGNSMRVWSDIQDVLSSASSELGRDIPPPVKVQVDFYPLSILLNKGILFGLESELVQRRDISFAYLRFATRTHLFLPPLLRHHLAQYNSPAALHLSHYYQNLLYFPHALEILLHDVLDEEVDTSPPPEQALLPSVLSFLSSFPEYLDIVVQCTRKTELRSWRTLFAYLPPPQDLFEESLQNGSLKTAGGYLLVLHTFEELSSSSHQLIRLLQRAKDEQDWDLCKELARFLMALDESGTTLREALELVELKSPTDERAGGSFLFEDTRLNIPQPRRNGIGVGIAAGMGFEISSGNTSRSGSRSPRSAASNGSVGQNPGIISHHGSIRKTP